MTNEKESKMSEEKNALTLAENYRDREPMTAVEIKKQVNYVQEIMKTVMTEGEHYGKIPGCGDKKVLLKSGAEKLSMTFRLAPTYEWTQIDHPGGHREFLVRTRMTHISTGICWGEGIGSCSTLESKYRYRSGEPELTERAVPKNYWVERDSTLLGGKNFMPKKVDGKWFIAKKSELRIENENPADEYNTVFKMAKKRSHVDACLTCTAASDIFTQKYEDIEDAEDFKRYKREHPEDFEEEKPPIQEPQRKKEQQKQASNQPETPPEIISQAQIKLFHHVKNVNEWKDDEVKAWLLSDFHFISTKDITQDKFETILTKLNGGITWEAKK